MKILKVNKRELNLNDYVKRSARESDYKTLITESTTIVDESTGKILAIYDELDFNCADLVAALKNIKYQENTRGAGLKTRSRIFGYRPRLTFRSDFCSVTSLADEQPAEHKIVCDYAKLVEDRYFKFDPEVYEKHKGEVLSKVRKDYRIGETVFTSGIINKNNPLKYHYDTGNFSSVFSCMLVFKGGTEGGYLALPEYDVGFQLKNNSLFMFDGQGILHGVTPIKKKSPLGFRYSIVYYSLKKMWQCLILNDELARIRLAKTKREQARQKRTPEYLAKLEALRKEQAKRR